MTGHHTLHPAPPTAAVEAALNRAVELARCGPRHDRNPRVGCVLLDPEGVTVGEGFHAGHGTPHAEAVALAAAGGSARGTTAVVTLEPCSHHGRTPPCADALVAAGITQVVYAGADPTHAGGGARVLREAGVVVREHRHTGAEQVVADWARAATLGRPHVTWKVASTLDGRVAAADGTSRWITSPESRAEAHRVRTRVGAVVVGTGTALADDPSLTARDRAGRLLPDQPLRVVVGHRDLPAGSRLGETRAGEMVPGEGNADGWSSGEGPRDDQVSSSREGPVLHLRTHDPAQVLAELRGRGVHSVLLEGGPTLAGAFWRAGLVDELLVHLAPALLGAGPGAVPDLGIGTLTDAARLDLVDVDRLGPDLQLRLRSVPGPATTRNGSAPTHSAASASTGTAAVHAASSEHAHTPSDQEVP
ncbi:riboflavin biosynthesis protein RibD [Serinicoccus sp. CNJ-927]|uniref:bifunctional diaminohydroxyphosphoribosylaminopyrimidine deaminase/5-amino-6-(5-phosphoribosylamino)uracil reductase RibD n=1 Tax=Serinicoccus sp. CNJ-927 TaxID=1904970 RepID=UPI000966BA6C|nr:bifunctional diaminohydroxyphosphoribosylaminopyrimidine deaminase/5-amino-6-(5-phosphoribosylamino)uracil reductase RibD [Serinicoccus sp. CNJ-927]OLT44923.1 riboflavin biosynthesis protein RibD [Serinicoccus sp. CNJ-927]